MQGPPFYVESASIDHRCLVCQNGWFDNDILTLRSAPCGVLQRRGRRRNVAVSDALAVPRSRPIKRSKIGVSARALPTIEHPLH